MKTVADYFLAIIEANLPQGITLFRDERSTRDGIGPHGPIYQIYDGTTGLPSVYLAIYLMREIDDHRWFVPVKFEAGTSTAEFVDDVKASAALLNSFKSGEQVKAFGGQQSQPATAQGA